MVLLFCSLYLLNRARKEGGDGQKARSKVYGGRKQVTEVNQDQSMQNDQSAAHHPASGRPMSLCMYHYYLHDSVKMTNS